MLAFAYAVHQQDDGPIDESGDDEMTEDESRARSRWLAAGSQDHRISIWELMEFSKK